MSGEDFRGILTASVPNGSHPAPGDICHDVQEEDGDKAVACDVVEDEMAADEEDGSREAQALVLDFFFFCGTTVTDHTSCAPGMFSCFSLALLSRSGIAASGYSQTRDANWQLRLSGY